MLSANEVRFSIFEVKIALVNLGFIRGLFGSRIMS